MPYGIRNKRPFSNVANNAALGIVVLFCAATPRFENGQHAFFGRDEPLRIALAICVPKTNTTDGVINMAKEKKKEMRERSKESKVRNKRNTDGDGYSCDDILRPRAYAHMRARQKREVAAKSKILRWLERLESEGVQDPVPQYVAIAVELCKGTPKDRLIWMKMANRNINSFMGVVEDFAIDLERPSMSRLQNPSAALQKRLNRVLPKPKSKSKPKSKDWGSGIGGGK